MTQNPEDVLKGKNRPFTGEEYIDSLKDGRQIWIYGEKVEDVTTHPAFRNSVRTVANMYDRLHEDRKSENPIITCDTDTGNGGFTHKFFRANKQKEDIIGQRDAIAEWARMSYGWMGRSPDYKASLMNTLGGNSEYYGEFAGNAKSWYKRAQENVLYMNHAIVNPPVDRSKSADEVKDVFITIDKETDAGVYVSGAKVVATGSAITHYNFLGQTAAQVINDDSLALMFIVKMNNPGLKLISRASYEQTQSTMHSPFDYPLSSRFDENDAIIVFDNAFIPFEDILIFRDPARVRSFYVESGFVPMFNMHGCTRLSVKLDFIAGLLAKCLKAAGTLDFRGVQAQLGEVIALRNNMWALTDAMVYNPEIVDGRILPNTRAASAYRVLAPDAYPKIKGIIQQTLTSSLIYLNSSVADFKNPEIDAYLSKYVRGSNGIDHRERIKLMKLMWDATGSEFGGRHELYERNYAGSSEETRLQCYFQSLSSGLMDNMQDLVDQCMSEYDEDGWTSDKWINNK